ncbi:MAG: group III truncated hemoglobin [Rhodobacteraceae bacterium]|nr:group III truncated hemoglobin [Paracoccaceae bacterium]
MPPRIDIERAVIADVVAAFYAKIRIHPVLGPVFAAHVSDWVHHEEKITRFWASAILHERSYDGNPMQIHMQAGDVHTSHFAAWLDIFEETVTEKVPAPQSEAWSLLARRIGRGLSMGVADVRRPSGAVPILR